MVNIILYWVIFFLPGSCILWLLNAKWALIGKLKPGGSLWLAIPTTFAISVTIISVLGWLGFFLKFTFIEVQFFFLILIILLVVISVIKLWRMRKEVKNFLTNTKFKKFSIKNYEFITALFILLVFLLAIYGGTWLSHTADSFGHMAAVRSIIKFDNPVPMQIFFSNPVSGMDPTFGTWHLALAVWKSLSGMDLHRMWLITTILIAPMIVLTYLILALELTKNRIVSLLTGLLYVIVIISGDFRISAQPNRMGQIFLWLSLIFLILSIRMSSETDNNSKWVLTVFAASFGWTSAAIHQQYPPVLLALVIPSLVIYYFVQRFNNNKTTVHSVQNKKLISNQILFSGLALLSSTFFGIIVRSSFTISKKYPVMSLSTENIHEGNYLELILQDLSTWFSGWDSYISIATIICLTLIIYLIYDKSNIKLETIIIIFSSLLVPLYIVTTRIFLGFDGLLFTVFIRLKLLTPVFLLVGWVWVLVRVIRRIPINLSRFSFRKLPKLIIDLSVVLISLYLILINVAGTEKSVINLYSSDSPYKYRLSVSKNSNLFKTHAKAINFFNTLSDDARILTDARYGYEFAGITGKQFILLPSQHTPLQEKEQNNLAYLDVIKFESGELNNTEMIEILLRQEVDYIYADRERYGGQVIWTILPTIPILEQVVGEENWSIYKVHLDKAVEYLEIDRKIKETDDFFEKLALLKHLEELFEDNKRYIDEISRLIPVDNDTFVELVNEGQNYISPNATGVVFDFLLNLDDALILSDQGNDAIKRTMFLIKKIPLGVLYQHPDSRVIYNVDIPKNSYLDFSIALDPDVWEQDKGDGVEFIVSVLDGDKKVEIFNQYINPKTKNTDRKWFNYSIDMNAIHGEDINLIFETKSGPNQDSRFDWAGWGEPRLRREVEYDLLKDWENLKFQSDVSELINKSTLMINGEKRNILFEHPPSAVSTDVYIPYNSLLTFGIGLDPEVAGKNLSDGVEFNVYILDSEKTENKNLVFSRFINPRDENFINQWQDFTLDLSNFSGRNVEIFFETKPGPFGDPNYDWSGWSSPVIIEK
jgi:hypothetical protein